MSREILLLVDALAREKNVDKDIVFGALEQALASATKKRFREDVGSVGRIRATYRSFRRHAVETLEPRMGDDARSGARALVPDIQLTSIEEPLEPGSLAGSVRRRQAGDPPEVRDAEREQIPNDFWRARNIW
jgi:N utilization substance protein A